MSEILLWVFTMQYSDEKHVQVKVKEGQVK